MKKRAEFLAAAQGARASFASLSLQMRPNGLTVIRIGFTATKKLGNAVVRNRAKRRLRAAAQAVMPLHAKPGHDYVLIGREGTVTRPFADLLLDLSKALGKVHSARSQETRRQ
jgi:ribonuclease P protein component